jgi:hypothetical protein
VNTPVVSTIKLGTTSFTLDKSVTDTAFVGSFDAVGCWASLMNVSGGSQTVTVTFTQNVKAATLIIYEVSGLATSSALDGTPTSFSGNPASTDVACTAVLTNVYNDDFWVVGIGTAAGGSSSIAAQTGWSMDTTNGRETNGASNQVSATAYIASPDATTGIGHITLPSIDHAVMAMCCYKSATAGVVDSTYYKTNFTLTENPISETSKWKNGAADGISWTNVRTNGSQCFGTETGSGGFDDSVAMLKGQWLANQEVVARVKTINQTSGASQEVEIFLRGSVSPKCITGYECQFSARGGALAGSSYVVIVKWNGAFGSFTELARLDPGPGLVDGDTIKATINGSTINLYINSVLVLTVNDSTWVDGQAGIGFFTDSGVAASSDYGFTEWQFGTPLPPPGGAGYMSMQQRY